MSTSPTVADGATSDRTYDPEVMLAMDLRDQGWTTLDFALFMASDSEQLRSMVLANLRSRRTSGS